MKEIQLTQGRVAIVDDEDYEELSKYKWHFGNFGYARTNIYKPDGRQTNLLMHRVILGAVDGQLVDHINHNGLDNRRENLRFATCLQNSRNCRSATKSTSQYKGVDWYKAAKKWRVQIRFNGVQLYLGLFLDEKDAARAYNAKAVELHGEFACLNVVD